MIELAGAFVSIIGISVLLWLARDGAARTSKTLWIAMLWLFLSGSRPLSLFLQVRVIGRGADDQLEGSPLDRNFFTLLIVIAIITLCTRYRKVYSLLRANALIVVFIAYCGLSILWSDYPETSFKRWIRLIGDLSMVLLVLSESDPVVAIKRVICGIGFVYMPLSILFDLKRGLAFHMGLTVSNKNLYGAMSMLVALGALWQILSIYESRRRNRGRLLAVYGSLAAMCVFCVWTANSSTAKACLMVGVVVMIGVRRTRLWRKPLLLHAGVVSVILLALYVSVINPHVGVVAAMGKDPTLTGRTEVWSTVLAMAPNKLVGAGFESFWLGPRLKALWSIFVWRPNEAHNGYIELYLNLGWAGVVLLSAILIKGYFRAVRGCRRDPEACLIGLTYIVVLLIYNLTEAGLRIFSPTWILLLWSVSNVPRRSLAGAVRRPRTVSGEGHDLSGTAADAELAPGESGRVHWLGA